MTLHQTDERQIAALIARGILESPLMFRGSMMVAIRITGTGISYRPQHREWVYRGASWLSTEMQQRCSGLVVTWLHPPSRTLDTESLHEQIVGVVLLGFIRESALWGVARILDQQAQRALREGGWDSSPAVQHGAELKHISIGKCTLQIESEPSLCDHVAICGVGIWGKYRGASPGVDVEGEKENAA
jgi:hypothetical protein